MLAVVDLVISSRCGCSGMRLWTRTAFWSGRGPRAWAPGRRLAGHTAIVEADRPSDRSSVSVGRSHRSRTAAPVRLTARGGATLPDGREYPAAMSEPGATAQRRPRLPRGRRGPAGRSRVRRADRVLPAGRGRRPRSDPAARRRWPDWLSRSSATSGAAAAGSGDGVDPDAAMEPFVAAFDAFHERTAPQSWLEGLVKAYVGDGIAKRLLSRDRCLPRRRDLHALVTIVLEDDGSGRVRRRGRSGTRSRPTHGSPAGSPCGAAGSWARRSPRPSAWRPSATRCRRCSSARCPAGADLAELGRMFARLTEEHTQRMARLGLSA